MSRRRPNWIARAWNRARATLRGLVPFQSANGGSQRGFRFLLPGSQYDYEAAAGDLWRNSAVAACLRWIRANFPEPRLQVVRAVVESKGAIEETPIPGHPVVALLDQPNGYYGGDELFAAVCLSLVIDGNAYLLKVRSTAGKVVELWWVPHWLIWPRWPLDGSAFIGWYDYEVNGRTVKLDPSEVIHLRHGIDPRNDRLGLADLKAAIRAVVGLNEADSYTPAILRNLGVPSAVISFEGDGTIGLEDVNILRDQWREDHTGEGAGSPLFASRRMTVAKLGMSPEELRLDEIPARLEDQVHSVIGISPMVTGCTSGSKHKTYANYGEARKAAYEDCLIPMQKVMSRQLTRQLLLADFDGSDRLRLRWDYSTVQCLAENETEVADRVGRLYQQSRVITRGEARRAAGFDAAPEDEIYFGDQATEDAQKTALNGAQISSLVEIVMAIQAGSVAPGSAKAMIAVAFPSIEPDQVAAIVDPAAAIEPPESDDDENKEPENDDGDDPDPETDSARRRPGGANRPGRGDDRTHASARPPTLTLTEDEHRPPFGLGDRARTPGTPPGDRDDPHQDNDFDLPDGRPIRIQIKRFGRRQLRQVLGRLPEIGAPLPHQVPTVTNWDDPMARAMTPLISAYWDEAGKLTQARLGLDPDAWEVHDPHLQAKIQGAALSFCAETNATTDAQLDDALAMLRDELAAGLVDSGEAIPELRGRVKSVFGRLSDDRAAMIARTEASRAVHAASLASARESGVVAGKVWLAATGSCDRCREYERQSREHPIPLDAEVDRVGHHPDYASIKMPPGHPHCRCSTTYILANEYEQILKDDGTPEGYEPGPLGPDPETSPKPATAGKPRKPKPEPEPDVLPPLSPEKSLPERLAAYKLGDRKIKAFLGKYDWDDTVAARKEMEKTAKAFRRYADSLQTGDRRRKAVREKLADLKLKAEEAEGAFHSPIKTGRSRLARILGGPKPGTISLGRPNDIFFTNAEAFVNSILRSDVPLPVQVHLTDDRPHAGNDGRSITVRSASRKEVIVHEIGHCIEFRTSSVPSAKSFLAHRAGDEEPKFFRDLWPEAGFAASEKGVEDRFGQYWGDGSSDARYCGKYYEHATELVSMGLQALYTDPYTFVKRDPEYAKFLFGILDGSLR